MVRRREQQLPFFRGRGAIAEPPRWSRPCAARFGISPGGGFIAGVHEAYDLLTPLWTPLGAMRAGVVTYAGWDQRFPLPGGARNGRGYYVDVDHLDGFLSRQIHMVQPPSVRVGDWVEQEEGIGYSGATGLTGYPGGPPAAHVHVAVFLNGVAVDWMYLPGIK